MKDYVLINDNLAIKNGFKYTNDSDIKMILRTEKGNVFVDSNNKVLSLNNKLLEELNENQVISVTKE